jgi:hypothetical protein
LNSFIAKRLAAGVGKYAFDIWIEQVVDINAHGLCFVQHSPNFILGDIPRMSSRYRRQLGTSQLCAPDRVDLPSKDGIPGTGGFLAASAYSDATSALPENASLDKNRSARFGDTQN